MTENKKPRLVFFDGYCGVCNGFVNFLLKIDKNDILLFTPLQGKTAKEHLDKSSLKDVSTIIFKDGDDIYYRSCAFLKILECIGGVWKTVLIFNLIPLKIRDYIYNYVAKNRYSWFGKRKTCRIPTEEEKEKILL